MSASQSNGTESNRPNAPIWLKILVGWHVIAITVWALPNPSPEILERKVEPNKAALPLALNVWYAKSFDPIHTYLFMTGTWQYWDMFAPNPANKDIWCDAEVVFKDGSTKIFQYPRMYSLSIPEKYVKERYRKFYERAGDINFGYFWPVMAQYIANKLDNPSNPPVEVRMRKYVYAIPPLGKPLTYDYTREIYYVYEVDPALLRKSREGSK